MRPLISVIVPVYKAEDSVERCIKSILVQTYSNWELLLVVDGVFDKSPNICQKYSEFDSRISTYIQENQGVSVARNLGMDKAKGDWFAFVDVDDYVEPNYLEELLAIAGEDADIAICDYWAEKGQQTNECRFFKFDSHSFMPNEKEELALNCMLASGFGKTNGETGVGVPWSKLYRKDFINKHGLRFQVGLTRMQDMIFNMYAFTAADKVTYRNIPLYHYVKNDSASTVAYRPDFDKTAESVISAVETYVLQSSNELVREALPSEKVLLFIEQIRLKFVPNKEIDFIEKVGRIKTSLSNEPYCDAFKFYDPKFLSKNWAFVAGLLSRGFCCAAYLIMDVRYGRS